MIRVNLLPHRQEKKAARQRQMMLAAGVFAAIGVLVGMAGHTYLSHRLEEQHGRNTYLQGEIKKLEDQIAKIKDVKEQTQDMLARKQVVESLQTNRAEAVHLIDQLVRQMPEGMWLKSVKQAGTVVNVQGFAQTNGRISTFMRNVEASPWLEKPELVEIKAAALNNSKISEFTMNVRVKRVEAEADTGSKKKGAGT
jgi:type IV pilus assembly protein PilN